MQCINNVIIVIQLHNLYIASIGLKDAIFSAPVHMDDQKFLKLFFENLFQLACMPTGNGPTMRVFSKISNVPFSHLKNLFLNSVVYVDDSYLQGGTYRSCLNNVLHTLKLLRELGFAIHPEKPILIFSQ